MGKNDVIMDNGKKAQGAMARYWKQQKNRQKNKEQHPHKKNPGQQNEQQQQDELKISVDKWKNHQLDMQMKKYDNRETYHQEKPVQQEPAKQVEPKQESQDVLVKKLDERELKIPGYGKASSLQKRLNVIEAPKTKTQQKQQSGVPEELKGLFKDEEQLKRILVLNKQKKKLKALAKEKERQMRAAVTSNLTGSQDPFEKTLQDEQYNPLDKEKKQDSEPEEPKEEPKFFKSQILNKLAEGSKLEQVIHKQVASVLPKEDQIKSSQQPVTEEKVLNKKPLFVPRSIALKKT